MIRSWLILLSLSLSSPVSAETAAQHDRPANFGTQWVRSHPFTITGLTALRKHFDPELYHRGGFGPALAFKNKSFVFQALSEAGIPYHYRVQPIDKGPLTDESHVEIEPDSVKT